MQSGAPPWYRPIRRLAMALTILLGAQIVLFVARVFAYTAQIRLLHRLTRGEFVTRAQEDLVDAHVIGRAGLWLFVFIATGVVWLVWQHRGQSNAGHLTTDKLMFSPGWAVGWWFIPLASLVQPFRAVRELWQASGGARFRDEGTWAVLVLWWIAWLGFDLFALLGRRPFGNEASALTVADELEVIAMLLGAASAAFAIAIVSVVVRRQESGLRAWTDVATPIPPPPPPPPGPR